MVIDDLADRQHNCDILLDQNLVADMFHRYDDKVPTRCVQMLGPNYALLQSQYSDLHDQSLPRAGSVRRLLIYFGGADVENLTGMAIAAFLSLNREDIALDVVINPDSPHANSIHQLTEEKKHIAVYSGLPTLANLMLHADLGIGAAGATTWERCCLGLPTLVITQAENQRAIAAELDRQNLIHWIGHKDEVDSNMLSRELREMLDRGLTRDWSENCHRIVDGHGAERVCRAMALNYQGC